MTKRQIITLFTTLCILMPLALMGQISLPSVISDNMVLQQNSDVKIWGWAVPHSEVSIKTGWDNKNYAAVADGSGKWQVQVQTSGAGGPFTIKINEQKLNNILLGEVWVCSGQSNMQWQVKQALNPDKEIAAADYRNIRLFYVARQYADEPKSDCYGKWVECNHQTVETFSAVAYFFGRELHKNLDIPIGLIHTSWGGTPAEAWTRKEVLASDNDLKIYLDRFNEKIADSAPGILPLNQNSPSSLYNAMIAPLIPFKIRGAIWYQGEANVREARLYEKLFPTMIKNWRTDWKQDFPFYFVQLAPYNYDVPLVGAALRDAQRKTLSLKNTGMAVTLDIGNPEDIHPKNKQDVGKRLAQWALAKDYGIKDVVWSGPLYKSMKIEKQKMRIHFNHVGSGLMARGGELTDFNIAGSDKIFYPGKATIEDNSVIVLSEKVKEPLAVRFAFSNTAEPNLFNKDGFPASSFRTDDWPIIAIPVQINGRYDPTDGGFRIELTAAEPDIEIRYTTDGSQPTITSEKYSKPLSLDKMVLIKARAFKDGAASVAVAEHKFSKHLAIGKNIKYTQPYSSKYPASGEFALVDGVTGSASFGDGTWQGYERNDLDVTIDLKTSHRISQISTRFLQNMGSWIFLPEEITYGVSQDGQNFKTFPALTHEIDLSTPGTVIKEFPQNIDKTDARYIRIRAKSIGICPQWHPGAGGKSWLFADEIIIN